MLWKNVEKIRRLKAKRYYEGLDGVEMENLKELQEMDADDRYWFSEENAYRDERRLKQNGTRI